jgi:transcriptional regulator with GAF, ATPase, and Fis domain
MLGEYMLKLGDRESRLRARKLISETLSFFENNEEYLDLAESHLLLARVERELGNRDDSLMHIYEGQRLAEDLKDRNLIRRLRRMRKRIEEDAVGARRARTERLRMPPELSGMFASDPHLQSYLDYVLGDLMRRLTAGHGFVTICSGSGGNRNIHVLARHGISEEATQALAEWFVSRENTDLTESVLITDTPHDSRTSRIRDMLPNETGPVYFHPLSKGKEPFGLLFFQSNGNGGEPPRMGSNYDIVSTYAGFIGFLIRGILGDNGEDEEEAGGIREGFPSIITSDEKMIKILNLAERVATSDSAVLLMGETGTGKGLIAEAIHRLSKRRDRKFVHVNCAALPETILESELFGHVKGSFTSAITDKKGLLAEADGGTIFLDEIGKTSLPLQGKLLQFLDTKKVRPVGSNEMFEVDVRLIFASKVDLLQLCREERMLEDFYYRINDFPLNIPPLRERTNDIILLADHYLSIFSEEMEKRIMGFSDEAICKLSAFEWRGNVRELEKVVKRAVILSEDNGMITPVELALDAEAAPSAANLNDRIRDLEKAMISDALCRNSWNRKAAASELGISYPTLLKKIKDFGIS